MPRTRRRSPQQGQPGQAYPNRTDLAQAPRAATGQQYGAAGAQIEAQKAVPMAGAPIATGAPPPQPAVSQGPDPGSSGPFGRPTERPDEPLTAGMALGAGPGPEALAMNQRDPDVESLAAYLPTLELLASQPNTSPTARNFIRRLRASVRKPQ